MYFENNFMYDVENIVEHITASLPIRKQRAGTIRRKMTNSDEGSEQLELA